jgi:hypothetical protein
MIVRRAAVGLSLLCALVFCAVAASSASAVVKGTTAFTCAPVAAGTGHFTDAHCDTEGTGSFDHVAIGEGVEKVYEITNAGTKNSTTEATPLVFKGVVGVPFEISCNTLSGSVTLTNRFEGGKMENVGTKVSANLTNCTVLKPVGKCTVKEGSIVSGVTTTSRTEVTYEKENKEIVEHTMDVELKPNPGNELFSFTLEGKDCPFKAGSMIMRGSAIGTGARGSTEATSSSGATLLFTHEMTTKTMSSGGNKIGLTGALTIRSEKGNAVTLTTSTE